MAIAIDELVQAGLLDGSSEPHLTGKGRDWLEALEEAVNREWKELDAEDLILSTNGLIR